VLPSRKVDGLAASIDEACGRSIIGSAPAFRFTRMGDYYADFVRDLAQGLGYT